MHHRLSVLPYASYFLAIIEILFRFPHWLKFVDFAPEIQRRKVLTVLLREMHVCSQIPFGFLPPRQQLLSY